MSRLLVITFLVTLLTIPSSPAIYKITKIECIPNGKYIESVSCHLKPINWQTTLVGLELALKLPIHKPFINFSSFAKNYANHYKPFIINFKANICDALSQRNPTIYSKVLQIIWNLFTNINHSCPFKGNFSVRNMTVNQNVLPITPPNGLYKFIMHYYEKVPSENILTVNVFITISDEELQRRLPSNKKRTKH